MTMAESPDWAIADPGSFRDASGHVFHLGERVLRTVRSDAASEFEYVRASGFFDHPAVAPHVIPALPVHDPAPATLDPAARYLLEHPRLPFISYPYEWCFSALKAAALLQVDLHLHALEHGVTLADASAYNVQFRGARPLFIDILSFRRYTPGEYWEGQQQFCEQYLNPLLLYSRCGVAHNAWYRGNLEGIPTLELARLMPLRAQLSWVVLAYVRLNARLQQAQFTRADRHVAKRPERPLTPRAFSAMLRQLRSFIARLQPVGAKATAWGDYPETNSYSAEEKAAKVTLVRRFVEHTKPTLVWDVGCNTGEYAALALASGAQRVIGFDFDQSALETAFRRASENGLDFLPLFLDAANPTPEQGWRQGERRGFQQRANADVLLALAVAHHLAIGRNVPLDQVVDWLVGLAPRGLIEFVPKSDPMIQVMLAHRRDIFTDYAEGAFTAALSRRARIIASDRVSSTGRKVFQFDRT
jgi:ribosomal protein L11 methylase PrmA